MCKHLHILTNLPIDDSLIEEARKVGGHKTKKDAVTEALEEDVRKAQATTNPRGLWHD